MYTTKDLNKALSPLYIKDNPFNVFKDWVEMMAISIANCFSIFDDNKHKKREETFLNITKKYNEEALDIFKKAFGMLINICSSCLENGFSDWLGQLYMESGCSNNKTGQFFTPYHVCRVLAKMSVNDELLKKEVITMQDPSVGGGALPIAFCEELHNKGVNFCEKALINVGDLDYLCVCMAYVQLSLIGVPARVYHMNSISQEVYDYFDTPALCMNWIKFRSYL